LSLSHRFPFRLVDRAGERRAIARWSAGAFWSRGEANLPLSLLVEAAAQAAALLLPERSSKPERLLMAGIDQARVERLLAPGESVEIEVRIAKRLGSLLRVEARAYALSERIGEAALTLILGE